MEPVYHLLLNGRKEGPFTLKELQQKLRAGEIGSGHLAWRPGLAAWTPVTQLVPPPLPPGEGGGAGGASNALARTPDRMRRRLSVWWWVLGAALIILGGLGYFVYRGVGLLREIGSDSVAYRPLFEDRAAHTPEWRESDFEAAGPPDVPAGVDLTLINFRAPVGELAAYLTPDPQDGKKHPAMVWAHSGFGGIDRTLWEDSPKRTDPSARALRESGFIMMYPSWRGENENPGRFEMFYGEVHDLVAAIEHLKSLPYVDTHRIYVGGQGAGATLALLAAGVSDVPRATFSLGAMLDGVGLLSMNGYGISPYDPDSSLDNRLRSPQRYAAFFRRPVFYFDGESDFEDGAAAKMRKLSGGLFQGFRLPGETDENAHPLTQLIAEKIKADTGEVSTIGFTDEELRRRHHEVYSVTLAGRLSTWMQSDRALSEVLGEVPAEDVVPRTTADISALAAAIDHLDRRGGITPVIAAEVAVLASARGDIENEEAEKAFDAEVAPKLVAWCRRRLAEAGDMNSEEAWAFLTVLAYLVDTHHHDVPALVVASVRDAKVPGHPRWNAVFGSFHDSHPHVGLLMQALAADPPAGATGEFLLDAANSLCHDDWKGTHPYDTAQGVAILRSWLVSADPEMTGFAHSAAFGAAFIAPENRGDLVALASAHADRWVRLEGAWSDVKTGGATGLARLQDACRDVHQSMRAQAYMEELGRKADIPPDSKDPEFIARATLSRWLQHPNELGKDPLTLDVVDHRTLHWPPTRDERPLWIIKFSYLASGQSEPKTGFGMVGSRTWSTFDIYAEPPPPEALYVHHCAIEMARESQDAETAAQDAAAHHQALAVLQKSNPGQFDSVPPLRIIENSAAGDASSPAPTDTVPSE